MAERKVLNKYFPPDFDPELVPRGSRTGKAPVYKIRLMAPFSMRCDNCGEFIYKGKKFNAKKEKVWGENYLGIQILRFFISCPQCSASISFKTDPQNADYICEFGASRNFESWREETLANDQLSFRKQMEEELDPMKKLENRTVDSKREIDILEALDEIRTRNARNERVDADSVLAKIEAEESMAETQRQVQLTKEEEEDQRLADFYFKKQTQSLAVNSNEDGTENGQDKGKGPLRIKRLRAEDVERLDRDLKKSSKEIFEQASEKKPAVETSVSNNHGSSSKTSSRSVLNRSSLGIVKKPASSVSSSSLKPASINPLSMIAQYNDSDSE